MPVVNSPFGYREFLIVRTMAEHMTTCHQSAPRGRLVIIVLYREARIITYLALSPRFCDIGLIHSSLIITLITTGYVNGLPVGVGYRKIVIFPLLPITTCAITPSLNGEAPSGKLLVRGLEGPT